DARADRCVERLEALLVGGGLRAVVRGMDRVRRRQAGGDPVDVELCIFHVHPQVRVLGSGLLAWPDRDPGQVAARLHQRPAPRPALAAAPGLPDPVEVPQAARTPPTMATVPRTAPMRLSLTMRRTRPPFADSVGARPPDRSGVESGLHLAMTAEPKQLEPMGVDAISAPPADLRDRFGDPGVLDVRRASAA